MMTFVEATDELKRLRRWVRTLRAENASLIRELDELRLTFGRFKHDNKSEQQIKQDMVGVPTFDDSARRDVTFTIPMTVTERLERMIRREVVTNYATRAEAWDQVCARIILAGLKEIS